MEDENKVVDTESSQEQNSGNVENVKKTFTQKELDEIVQSRLAKESKKYPSKEELNEFKKWKESQKTETEKNAEKEAEYQKAIQKNLDYEKKFAVLNAGVKAGEDAAFVQFRVSQMEGDFNDNLATYLKDNPKFLASYQNNKSEAKPVSLGTEHKTSNASDELADFKKVMGIK